jgi:hypothetical protein
LALLGQPAGPALPGMPRLLEPMGLRRLLELPGPQGLVCLPCPAELPGLRGRLLSLASTVGLLATVLLLDPAGLLALK